MLFRSYDGRIRRKVGQRAEDGLEELATIDTILRAMRPTARQQALDRGVVGYESGDVVRAVERHTGESFAERQVWRGRITKIDTMADQALHAKLARDRDQLAEQARLADACVAPEDHSRGAAGAGTDKRRPQNIELVVSTYEWSCSAGHVLILALTTDTTLLVFAHGAKLCRIRRAGGDREGR